jgi:hypothetical protein
LKQCISVCAIGQSALIFEKKLLDCLPNNHLWTQSAVQFQIHGGRESNKKLAIRQSIVHHLHLSLQDQKKTKYLIYPHHFLQTGWQHSPKQKSNFIGAMTAKQFDKTVGRIAYYDQVNSVEYILQTIGGRKVKKGDEREDVCGSSCCNKK